MKRRLTTLGGVCIFLAMLGTAGAQTFWTGRVADAPDTFVVEHVQNFDWAASGSGSAEGMAAGLMVGDVFTFRYQSFLFALNAPNGDVIPFSNLNDTFEYTVVAEFPEVVLNLAEVPSPPATLATFSTLSGGKFFIYWDGAPNADVASGTGFDDGTLVASGFISPDQLSTFSAMGPNAGLGAFIIYGLVEYVNPAFLDPDKFFELRIEGTINQPASDSTTTAFFTGRGTEGNLDSYAVTGNDTLFKVDASHKFLFGEEPPGTCRVTAGGVKEVAEDLVTFTCQFKPNGQIDPKTCASYETTQKGKTALTFKDTWGGQAGASGIDGNWTHHHSVSPSQSFVFHSNEVNEIICGDPGVPCTPAGANATHRQIDFKGSGKFVNQKGFDFPAGDLCYTVHLEDIGEPGPGGRWPTATDQCTHIPGTPIDNATDCMNCTDYYEIRIFGNAECSGAPIYVNGNEALPSPLGGYFITSGNVQMHPGK